MKQIRFLLVSSMLIGSTMWADKAVPSMFQEARSGNAQAIKNRISNCENCTEKDENGNTILHIAAQEGHAEIVDALTTQPDYSGWGNWWYSFAYTVELPNKDEKNNEGNTALHCAIKEGKEQSAACLLEKGAATDLLNKEEQTAPFMILSQDNPVLIPLLIKHNCLGQKRKGDTLLHESIKRDKPRVAERLFQETSLLKEKDIQGKTAITLALKKAAFLAILKRNNISLNDPDNNGLRPIHDAARDGDYTILKTLLDNSVSPDVTDSKGNTPLHYAAAHNNQKEFDLLLAYKANMNQRNNDGEDTLLMVAGKGNPTFLKYIAQKPGVNINTYDNYHTTAAIRAASVGEYADLDVLIKLGANIQMVDINHQNVLHMAAAGGFESIAKLVLKTDKKLLETKNKNGNTPLFLAAKYGHPEMIKTLAQEHGACINIANKNGEIPLFGSVENGFEQTTQALLQCGASLLVRNQKGDTILHVAAQQKNEKILHTLLEQKNRPNIDTINSKNLTALHSAAQNNNIIGMKELEQYGANWNHITQNGHTLAHSAITGDASDALDYIMERDPRLADLRNKNNETPFEFASAQGSLACVKKLLRDNDFVSRSIEHAMTLAQQHNQQAVVQFLNEKIGSRKAECQKVTAQYSDVKQLIKKNQKMIKQLATYNPTYVAVSFLYSPAELHYYSKDELYHMPQSQREKIQRDYLKSQQIELDNQSNFSHQLTTYRLEAAAQELHRINEIKRQEAEKERLLREHEAQIAAQQERINQINEENRRAEMIKNQQILDEKNRLDQQKELDRYAQEKAQKNALAAQKAEADRLAINKALADQEKARQAQQQNQPQHLSADMVPSAPTLEVPHQKCVVCQGKPSVKPLPCKKCKIRCADICNTCFKQYDGQCPSCYKRPTTVAQEINECPREKGECCFGLAACTEENGVTIIPCTQCKKPSSSDRVCKGCLDALVKDGIQKGYPKKCPRCTQNTLEEALVEKILQQP